MKEFIFVLTVILVILYACFAIYTIVKAKTMGGSIGTTCLFSAGGIAAIPVASFLATCIYWIIIIAIIVGVLILLGYIFG